MLSDDLKAETKSNHQLLERKMMARLRLMKSKQDYIDILAIFYSFLAALELLIMAHLRDGVVNDYDRRRKAAALSSDLDRLNGKIPSIAPVHFLPKIDDHESALGALYVIEGSSLGGQIIGNMVHKQLSLHDGLTFFNGYGEETGAMWKLFQAVLNKEEHLPGTKIITGANDTFLKFGAWFDLNA